MSLSIGILKQLLLFYFYKKGSDEESEEESSDESDWSESDEESDSEAGGFDLDVCPPGCDQNLYDNTCALREKRYVFFNPVDLNFKFLCILGLTYFEGKYPKMYAVFSVFFRYIEFLWKLTLQIG